MTLGDIIKNYRVTHSLSMDAFSEKSGISKAYISLLEKNKHPKTGKPIAPSIQCIKQAADGMSMDFDTLFKKIDGSVVLDEEENFSSESTISERIKKLRKALNLTQTEFGERLGVSRSVINNIERNALARPDQKLSLYKLICNEFNVREEWLLNGIEPKFVQPDMFSLDEFIKARGGTELELEIVKIYFELDPDLRKALLSHFRSRLAQLHPVALVPDTPEDLETLHQNDIADEDAG